MDLHQRHDMTLPTMGRIEKLRVQGSPSDSDQWILVGDVYVEGEKLDEALKGFSISATSLVRPAAKPSSLLYLPYPAYNDQGLIERLALDTDLSIGKIKRKGAEVEPVAILVGVILLLLKPAWEEYYARVVSPSINRFLETHFDTLHDRGIAFELSFPRNFVFQEAGYNLD